MKEGLNTRQRARRESAGGPSNSPNQSLPPRPGTQLLGFPHKADQFTPDDPIPTISRPLKFLLGNPPLGDRSLSLPSHDLFPDPLVDGVMDGDYDGHVLGTGVAVLALKGGVERGRGGVDPVLLCWGCWGGDSGFGGRGGGCRSRTSRTGSLVCCYCWCSCSLRRCGCRG